MSAEPDDVVVVEDEKDADNLAHLRLTDLWGLTRCGHPDADGAFSRSREAISSLTHDETILRLGRSHFSQPTKRARNRHLLSNSLDQTKGIDHVGHNHRLILPSGLQGISQCHSKHPVKFHKGMAIRSDAAGECDLVHKRVSRATLTMLNSPYPQSLTTEIANGRYRTSVFSRVRNSG